MKSDFQNTVTMISPLYRPEEIARFLHTDGVVGRLSDFPELTQAGRDRDLKAISTLCEQLLHSATKVLQPYRPHCRVGILQCGADRWYARSLPVRRKFKK